MQQVLLFIQSIGSFFKENMVTLLGAFLPVLGSVFLIHYGNYAEEKKKYQVYIRRFSELLKYNMEIAQARIINNTELLEFSQEKLNEVLSDLETTGKSHYQKFNDEMFELVFAIGTGEQLNIGINEFYKIIFEQTRKANANFLEMAKIIDSVGIDRVFEFKILRRLILLTRKMKLETIFDKYYDMVHSISPEVDVETCIRYFIVELINQHRFGISNKVYYINYALEKQLISATKLSAPSNMEEETPTIIADIKKQFVYYQDIIHEFHKMEVWLDFLDDLDESSVTLQADRIGDVNESLKQMYARDDKIYLSFLGICSNGDALDNNGRSRQDEFLNKKRSSPYDIKTRSWYEEALIDARDDVTITFPYIDTSRSYVTSFVKKVYLGDEIIGAIGLDVIVDDVIREAVGVNAKQLIVFTFDGEIVFDSTDRNNSSKMFFDNSILKYGIELISLIHTNSDRYVQMNRKAVYFATLVRDKYYCLIV